MARTPACHAEQASEDLDAVLRERAGVRPQPAPGAEAPPDGEPSHGPPGTRIPVEQARGSAGAPLRLPNTEWLGHQLTVAGEAAGLDAFRDAAAGAGTIPWQLDLDALQEDWFHLLAAPAGRQLSLSGARILAGQLREAVERRHALAVARVGHSRACPLDLHSLVPVPPATLALGPDHPDALGWLWSHWGTTQALRHVRPLPPDREALPPRAGEAIMRVGFCSTDWSPWRAFAQIQADWPALRFYLRPDYGG